MKTIIIGCGEEVICDFCNKEWTELPTQGGFLFQSKAVCPDCASDMMKTIKKYHEESFIRGECPENMSFAQWVRSIR